MPQLELGSGPTLAVVRIGAQQRPLHLSGDYAQARLLVRGEMAVRVVEGEVAPHRLCGAASGRTASAGAVRSSCSSRSRVAPRSGMARSRYVLCAESCSSWAIRSDPAIRAAMSTPRPTKTSQSLRRKSDG